jgi:coenzyme PQQ precursor peptide PqqA
MAPMLEVHHASQPDISSRADEESGMHDALLRKRLKVSEVPRSSPPHNTKRQFSWGPAARRYIEEVMTAAIAPRIYGVLKMAWKAPKIVEMQVGMEINMYACAAHR